MRTVVGHSARGVMKVFLVRYQPPKGDIYEVKPRGHGEWETFKVT